MPARVTPEVAAQIPAPFEPGIADWDADKALRANRDYYSASVKAELELSDSLDLISTTSYQDYKQNNFRDTDGSALDVFSVRQIGSVKSIFQELRLVGNLLDGRAEFTIGGSYARDKTEEANTAFVVRTSSARGFLPFGIQPFAASLASDQQKITTKAIFGSVEFELTDEVSVIGGVRYTKYRNEFSGCTIDVDGNLAAGLTIIQGVIKSRMPNPTPVIPIARGTCITLDAVTANPGVHFATLAQDNISWRTGVNFKPSPSTLIYLTASKGYKSGSFPNINATSSLALRPVSQESVLAFEGGVKADVIRSTHIEASAFYYDYTDKQLRGRIIDPGGVLGALEALVNVPQSRAWGIEASVVTRPVDGLSLRASGLYLDTEVTKDFLNFDPFGVAANFRGNSYPFSPRWSFQASADYETAVSSELNMFAGASISSQSSSTSAFGGAPLVAIAGYEIVGARFGVANPDQGWRATVWVKNLFDKYYWTDTFRQVDNLSRHVGMGRSAGIELSYAF
ncbi:TonB-dependent receptor [Sphingopyxis sp.]|uniref:TonB-dependent receptor domain-containing protein n=1 Tax=Sphingopyxis sp. TaxID=1908224 RepID=UPI0025F67F7E|nr:TonB-dependent receptor [Sphingopyxis sp.]MBK6411593.1 TonB-dependent receptor [Sphingopyxis sp.]